MTEEQKKIINRRITIISIVDIVVLAVLLILIGVNGLVETWLFPTVMGVFLAMFWFVSDVLYIKWTNGFEGKTDDQKKSYYVYSALNLIGLGGLVYFIVDMNSTTGAIIYVCTMFLKKKFREDYKGPEEDEEAEDVSELTENTAEAEDVSELAENTAEAEGISEVAEGTAEAEDVSEAPAKEQPEE